MRVRLDACALAVAGPGEERFEAVRERIVPVGPEPRHGKDALEHALIECRPNELIDGRVCARCQHLLNAVPAVDGRSLLVRCMFLELDPIEKLMTRAVDVVSVSARDPLAVAATRMLNHDVEQLVVVADGEVVGLVTARDVEQLPPTDGEAVANRTIPLPVVPRTMSIGAAARALRVLDVDCAGVIDGDELVGLITRGDLRRVGVPEI